jgi:hypothetical protein
MPKVYAEVYHQESGNSVRGLVEFQESLGEIDVLVDGQHALTLDPFHARQFIEYLSDALDALMGGEDDIVVLMRPEQGPR